MTGNLTAVQQPRPPGFLFAHLACCNNWLPCRISPASCHGTAQRRGSESRHGLSYKRALVPRCLLCRSGLGGEFPIRPRKRSDWQLGPAFDLSQEQAVEMQLQVVWPHLTLPFRVGFETCSRHLTMQALKQNDEPSRDHGIEVLYRFAGKAGLICKHVILLAEHLEICQHSVI